MEGLDGQKERWIDELRDYVRRLAGNVVIKLADKEGGTRISVLDATGAEVAQVSSAGVVIPSAFARANTWRTTALLNGWADFGGFQGARYWKDDTGMVLLQGVVGGGSTGVPILNLPAGYRPAYSNRYCLRTNAGNGQVDISQLGALTPWSGGTTWQSISNVFYRVDHGINVCNYVTNYANSWVDWSSGAEPVRFWRDQFGVVHLEGMMSGGTITATSFTLPPGYRPAQRYLFACVSNGSYARIDVDTAGNVSPQSGSNAWMSLCGVHFLAENGYAPWVAPTLTNFWLNFAAGYNDAGYWKDGAGRVHLKGLLKSGNIGQAFFTLPVGYRPAGKLLFSCGSAGAQNRVDVDTSGTVTAIDGSNTWASIDGIVFRAE
jgi:hypothetical protein